MRDDSLLTVTVYNTLFWYVTSRGPLIWILA